MDLIALPIDIPEEKIGSRYRLAILGAQRARQIMEGSPAVVPSRYLKPTSAGLVDILAGNLEFLSGKEARTAIREAKRQREEEAKSRALLDAKEEEIASEIRKDLSIYLEEKAAEAERIRMETLGPEEGPR